MLQPALAPGHHPERAGAVPAQRAAQPLQRLGAAEPSEHGEAGVVHPRDRRRVRGPEPALLPQQLDRLRQRRERRGHLELAGPGGRGTVRSTASWSAGRSLSRKWAQVTLAPSRTYVICARATVLRSYCCTFASGSMQRGGSLGGLSGTTYLIKN